MLRKYRNIINNTFQRISETPPVTTHSRRKKNTETPSTTRTHSEDFRNSNSNIRFQKNEKYRNTINNNTFQKISGDAGALGEGRRR